jgi:hypothetical protein
MQKRAQIILRAVSTIGATLALAGGVTFAAGLSSSATLSDSSVLSKTASLKVRDSQSGDFVSSAPGFTITDLVPGTGDTEHMYLQNDGGVPLDVTAHVPTLPGPPLGGYGFTGFNNLTVQIVGWCGAVVNTNMQQLNNAQVKLPCNPLDAGATGDPNTPLTPGNFDFHFDIKPSAITGSQAGVGNFDIDFTGTQHL